MQTCRIRRLWLRLPVPALSELYDHIHKGPVYEERRHPFHDFGKSRSAHMLLYAIQQGFSSFTPALVSAFYTIVASKLLQVP